MIIAMMKEVKDAVGAHRNYTQEPLKSDFSIALTPVEAWRITWFRIGQMDFSMVLKNLAFLDTMTWSHPINPEEIF